MSDGIVLFFYGFVSLYHKINCSYKSKIKRNLPQIRQKMYEESKMRVLPPHCEITRNVSFEKTKTKFEIIWNISSYLICPPDIAVSDFNLFSFSFVETLYAKNHFLLKSIR